FEEKKKIKHRDLATEDARLAASWSDREAALALRKAEFDLQKAKVDASPQELDEVFKKAREEAIRDTFADAKVKSDLTERKIEANRKVFTLQIQSLEGALAKQAEQTTALTAQLEAAVKQTQDL